MGDWVSLCELQYWADKELLSSNEFFVQIMNEIKQFKWHPDIIYLGENIAL